MILSKKEIVFVLSHEHIRKATRFKEFFNFNGMQVKVFESIPETNCSDSEEGIE